MSVSSVMLCLYMYLMYCVKVSTDNATCCFVLAFICVVYVADCEMISLIEDDTGMELLVCNKIISLDLLVKEVYKKIWCTQPDVSGGVMGGGGGGGGGGYKKIWCIQPDVSSGVMGEGGVHEDMVYPV